MDDGFHFATDVHVRFRDLDVMNQVHNAVLLTYVEEARVRYFDAVLDVALAATDGAIAHQSIDYHAPLTFESAVTVRYRVDEVGESSLEMAFEVVDGGETAATGTVVHVVLDEGGDTRPVPDRWRERIRAFESGDAAES